MSNNRCDQRKLHKKPKNTWTPTRQCSELKRTDGAFWNRPSYQIYATGQQNRFGGITTPKGINRSSPVQVSQSVDNWIAVSQQAGTNWVMAIKFDKTLWAWGENGNGRLGQNDSYGRSFLNQIPGRWKKMSTGQGHAAAIKEDGTLWTWGYNGSGELGQNDRVHRSSPTQVMPSIKFKQVKCGYSSTFAISEFNNLYSWGRNDYGYLGNNTRGGYHRSSPIQIPGQWSEKITCGNYHVMAIKKDGKMMTWGRNWYLGQGHGNDIPYSSPICTFMGGWESISAGGNHSGVVGPVANGAAPRVFLWGNNNRGQLGQNDRMSRSNPIQMQLDKRTSSPGGTGVRISVSMYGGNMGGSEYNNYYSINCGHESTLLTTRDGGMFSIGCQNNGFYPSGDWKWNRPSPNTSYSWSFQFSSPIFIASKFASDEQRYNDEVWHDPEDNMNRVITDCWIGLKENFIRY